MRNLYSYCLTIASLAVFLPITASSQDEAGAERPLFATAELLEVRIEAPLSTLMRQRSKEEYLDGKFSIPDADGNDQVLDLKIRARGRYRHMKKTCNFPPVRLNFRKKQVEGTVFEGQDKLKLVTHCQNSKARYEQIALREYLAYQLLRALTDKSFGARLMRITYVNTEDDDETMVRYGFVIEDEDDVGARFGLSTSDKNSIRYSDLDARHTNLVNVFEYMIGNTDFSLVRAAEGEACCHNAVIFGVNGQPPYLSIPYDFDFAGIVNAPYAEPHPQFKIRNVRTRVYRGRCSNSEILAETFDYYREKQAEIFALVDGIPGLDPRFRTEIVKYLNVFYAEIGDEKTIQRKFVRKCS